MRMSQEMCYMIKLLDIKLNHILLLCVHVICVFRGISGDKQGERVDTLATRLASCSRAKRWARQRLEYLFSKMQGQKHSSSSVVVARMQTPEKTQNNEFDLDAGRTKWGPTSQPPPSCPLHGTLQTDSFTYCRGCAVDVVVVIGRTQIILWFCKLDSTTQQLKASTSSRAVEVVGSSWCVYSTSMAANISKSEFGISTVSSAAPYLKKCWDVDKYCKKTWTISQRIYI